MGACQSNIAFGLFFLGAVGGVVAGVILRDICYLIEKK